jgi:antiviral helicase SKI2
MSVEIFTEKDKILINNNDIIIKLPFELDNFQKQTIISINKKNNVIICVPTGSGKTYCAIHAIAHALKQGKKAIYCSPIKTLSNEKFKEFREKFGKEFLEQTNIQTNIGLVTGDYKINTEGNIVIMTTEILRNSLYKLKTQVDDSNKELKNNFLDDVAVIVFDEIHYINDKDRGHVWEESLTLIDKNIQIVGLSATINNPENFAGWLANIKNKNVSLIITTKRPVPLQHHIYTNNKLYLLMDEDNTYSPQTYQISLNVHKEIMKQREKKHKSNINYNLIPELVEYLRKENKLQALFFSFSRLNCQHYASLVKSNLITIEERKSIENIFNSYMHKYEKQYSILQQYQELKKLLFNGIAFHHSGLLPILKEIVEILFQQKLIKVLFCTETYAIGVNTSTRTVVFTELEKHTKEGKRFLETHEYRQISGRAGRRGIDKLGTAIILPLYEFPNELNLKSTLLGKVPSIQSKFKIDYNFFLKIIQSQASNFSKFMDSSLYTKQHENSIGFTIKNLQDIQTTHNINLKNFDNSLFDEKLDKNDILTKFTNLYNFQQKKKTIVQIKILLDKNSQKEYDRIDKEIKSNNILLNLYSKYKIIKDSEVQLKLLSDDIEESKRYIDNSYNNTVNFLKNINYLSQSSGQQVTDKDITLKGVVASHINECNAIILTELIINKYFERLTPEEIVGLLAIFIDDCKENEDISYDSIDGTDNIYDRIVNINKFIDEMQELEITNNILYNQEYWKLRYNYIDIAYMWASGYDIKTCLENRNIFEGNFIKNMLKIHNIVHDVECLCKLAGYVDLLPVLEKIGPLIIRDIVTINSLYLS